MRLSVLALAGTALVAWSTIASADDNGALTGAAGGAVTGAVVGGPVGAAVGGVAGAVVGGAATGAPRPEPVQPCATRTTTMTNNNTGSSRTTQTTDCPD
jgi:outer membrane lipoprotein SlyB